LPLAGSAWFTAIGFTVLNAWLLTVRIRCEVRALAGAAVPGAGASQAAGGAPGGSTVAGAT